MDKTGSPLCYIISVPGNGLLGLIIIWALVINSIFDGIFYNMTVL